MKLLMYWCDQCFKQGDIYMADGKICEDVSDDIHVLNDKPMCNICKKEVKIISWKLNPQKKFLKTKTDNENGIFLYRKNTTAEHKHFMGIEIDHYWYMASNYGAVICPAMAWMLPLDITANQYLHLIYDYCSKNNLSPINLDGFRLVEITVDITKKYVDICGTK